MKGCMREAAQLQLLCKVRNIVKVWKTTQDEISYLLLLIFEYL